MELYIKESREDYLEVIDMAYPQYLFILDGIKVVENEGHLELLVEKMSTLRTLKKGEYEEVPEHLEDDFLEQHGEKIVKEIFDPVLKSALR